MIVSYVDMWFATYMTGPSYSLRAFHPSRITFIPRLSAHCTEEKQMCAHLSTVRSPNGRMRAQSGNTRETLTENLSVVSAEDLARTGAVLSGGET
jgi:hypothetical protein